MKFRHTWLSISYVSPKVYDELEEITGYSRSAIQQFKSTADKIDSCCRQHDVSFEHHRIARQLPPEQQKEFLQKASEEKTSDLRQSSSMGEQFYYSIYLKHLFR